MADYPEMFGIDPAALRLDPERTVHLGSAASCGSSTSTATPRDAFNAHGIACGRQPACTR